MRPRSFEDHPIPSGNSVRRLRAPADRRRHGRPRYERRAVGVLRLLHRAAARHPQAFGHLLQAMHFHFSGAARGGPGRASGLGRARRASSRARFRPTRRARRQRAGNEGARSRSRSCAAASRRRPSRGLRVRELLLPAAGDRARGSLPRRSATHDRSEISPMAEAFFWGLVGGSSLLLGAVLGLVLEERRKLTGLVLAFGAGTLISALTFELTRHAYRLGGADAVTLGLAAGALAYFLGDRAIDRRGGDGGDGAWQGDAPHACRHPGHRTAVGRDPRRDEPDRTPPTCYGNSEAAIAEALHPYPEGLVIATKGGQTLVDGSRPPTAGPSTCAQPASAAWRRCASTRSTSTSSTCPTRKCRSGSRSVRSPSCAQEGKVREIGVSNVFGEQLELARRAAPIVSVQNRYSLMHRESAGARSRSASARAWRSCRGGRSAAASSRASAQQQVARLAAAPLPGDAPDPGTASVEHLEENVAAAECRLTPDEVADLEAAVSPDDRGCGARRAARRATSRPSCPSRSRTPTTRQPNDSHSARLASFSGKIQPSSVQIPARSEASTRPSAQRRPDATPALAAARTCSPRRRRGRRAGETGQRRPCRRPRRRAARPGGIAQMLAIPLLPGAATRSNVAWPVAMPSRVDRADGRPVGVAASRRSGEHARIVADVRAACHWPCGRIPTGSAGTSPSPRRESCVR